MHECRCDTCNNIDCDNYNNRGVLRSQSDRDGRLESAASFTFSHGCMLHPKAREYLNKSVIEELELMKVRSDLLYDEKDKAIAYQEVIALLRGDGK